MQEKKENRFVPRPPKWLLFVPLGLLAVYVTIQLVAVLDNRYETETAIQDTLTDSVQLDGVLLFAQQPPWLSCGRGRARFGRNRRC